MTPFDTRGKILDPARAVALASEAHRRGSRVIVVTGYFDIVQTHHVQRLGGLARDGETLIAVVLDPPHPLLSRRARAELVAALAAVDYVLAAGDHSVEELLSGIAADEIVREEENDLRRAAELTEHVRKRHAG